jgi:ribosomal protein S18 acetylase RimI-like enzyme
MSDVLDNPVWHALTGPQASLAVGSGLARHFPRDIAPFSAIEDASPEAYADLGLGLPPNTEARLFRPTDEPLPNGWQKVDAFPMLQIVFPHAGRLVEDAPVPDDLSEADAPAMQELAKLAQPGPFGARTHLLGRFVGYRDNGRLVAMAGERMRLPGYTELSAICTHPEFRGQGHAERLTSCLMRRAVARGETPFLHVRPENKAAALYAKLGFVERRTLWMLWRRPIKVSA